MTSQRPYLLRALYDWVLDNNDIPYLLVNANAEGVVVPTEYVQEGQIVLNIGPTAVRNLELGNEWIMFDSRFAGRSFEVAVPVEAVRAIYGKEAGQGMAFPEEDSPGQPTGSLEQKTNAGQEGKDPDDDPDGSKPSLRLV